jgi:hypothetical protein
MFKMQPNALLFRQNFIIREKWVLHEAEVNGSGVTVTMSGT